MFTDYIIFIHGVNVRNEEAFKKQANSMFQSIKANINNPSRILKPIILFWGNIGESKIQELLQGFTSSSQWSKFWFNELRTTQILPFVGDAAMYLSRAISKKIVQQITEQAINQIGLSTENLRHPPEGDRLHLVTHSWGTVVLFDILFSPRWEEPVFDENDDTPEKIKNIRRSFFGVGSTSEEKSYGIPLASIHTMGSPIALINLVNVSDAKSFNLTPQLKEFLAVRQTKMENPLAWNNYAHPGDPIAYPLEGVMPLLLGEAKDLVNIKDIMSPSSWLGGAFGQTILSIVNGGKAHSSYWTEQKVAQVIGNAIQSTQS
jgi:hypothetical protein